MRTRNTTQETKSLGLLTLEVFRNPVTGQFYTPVQGRESQDGLIQTLLAAHDYADKAWFAERATLAINRYAEEHKERLQRLKASGVPWGDSDDPYGTMDWQDLVDLLWSNGWAPKCRIAGWGSLHFTPSTLPGQSGTAPHTIPDPEA
jgi:hypothetical protein